MYSPMEVPSVRVFALILLTGAWASGEYLGCYEDSGRRLFSDYRSFLNDINSPSRCGYVCSRLDYSYAGVEHGNECFCSHQRPSEDKKKSDKDCQTPCPNSKEKCGGFWRLSVYSVEPYRQPNTGSEDNGTIVGCYEDSGKRLLADFQIKLAEINTPRKCSHVCSALGFPYAGVEHGIECFCSKQRPEEEKRRSDKDCQTACPHSTTETCGGFWRVAVYNSPFYPHSDVSDEDVSRGYIGCFEDNRNRLLNDYKIHLDDVNTPRKCLHICRQLGYKYAGVEFGKECFCGNQRPDEDKKRSESDCRSSCPNSKEKCGGLWRLSAYATKAES